VGDRLLAISTIITRHNPLTCDIRRRHVHFVRCGRVLRLRALVCRDHALAHRAEVFVCVVQPLQGGCGGFRGNGERYGTVLIFWDGRPSHEGQACHQNTASKQHLLLLLLLVLYISYIYILYIYTTYTPHIYHIYTTYTPHIYHIHTTYIPHIYHICTQ